MINRLNELIKDYNCKVIEITKDNQGYTAHCNDNRNEVSFNVYAKTEAELEEAILQEVTNA